MPNFTTYKEAEQYVQGQESIFAARLKEWWNHLTPEQKYSVMRAKILADHELKPHYKQQLLREASQELGLVEMEGIVV